jgi:hypothetical protein
MTSSPALAGTYDRMVDDFTGLDIEVYKSTRLENVKGDGVMFVLREFDPNDGTVELLVGLLHAAASHCSQYKVALKSANGEMHSYEASSDGQPKICAARIPAEWIKESFTVRVPVYLGPSATATFSTKDLDLMRIAKKP